MRSGRDEARAKWAELVSAQSMSSQSVSAYCQEHGLRVWQFYEWKKRLRDSDAPKFVEVAVKPPAAIAQQGSRQGSAIEVRLRVVTVLLLSAASMRAIYVAYCWYWRARHDRSAEPADVGWSPGDADLACGRSNGHALWFRSASGAREGIDQPGPSQRPSIRISIASGRKTKDPDVGWRWICALVQVTGFTLHLFRFDLKVLLLSFFCKPEPDLRAGPSDCCAWLAWNLATHRGTRAHCGRVV
jgi:hypothetical protein